MTPHDTAADALVSWSREEAEKVIAAADQWLAEQPAQPPAESPSPTTGMTITQRILHVGGRNNAAGYVEFGSIQAVEALIAHVLRDIKPAVAQPWGYHAGDGSPAHPAERVIQWPEYNRARMVHPVYAAPVERPLTDEAVGKILLHCHAIPPGVSLVRLNGDPMDFAETMAAFARAIERAHGIGQPAGGTK